MWALNVKLEFLLPFSMPSTLMNNISRSSSRVSIQESHFLHPSCLTSTHLSVQLPQVGPVTPFMHLHWPFVLLHEKPPVSVTSTPSLEHLHIWQPVAVKFQWSARHLSHLRSLTPGLHVHLPLFMSHCVDVEPMESHSQSLQPLHWLKPYWSAPHEAQL